MPPLYFYRREDVKRIPEALAAGCGADALGKLRGVAEPADAVAHVRDARRKRYDVGYQNVFCQKQDVTGDSI